MPESEIIRLDVKGLLVIESSTQLILIVCLSTNIISGLGGCNAKSST